jgi:hypothetical protein
MEILNPTFKRGNKNCADKQLKLLLEKTHELNFGNLLATQVAFHSHSIKKFPLRTQEVHLRPM